MSDASMPPEPAHDLPAAESLAIWLEACRAAGCPERTPAEVVPLNRAVGRVTAEPVLARRSSPAYDAAAMDGIAVHAAQATAGAVLTDFVVVDTGDPMPTGYDAVVMREDVTFVDDKAEVGKAAEPGKHVRPVGEDVREGETLLPAGLRLQPWDVAAAAAAGHENLTVHQAPRVAIVPTGDEIRPLGSRLEPGDILDTNSLMLAAQAEELGCRTRILDIVPDEPPQLLAAMRDAAATSDLVLFIAGSSKGRGDHTADVVAAAGALAVHGVAVRPGHPVVLGVAGRTPVLGAPGYPVSAALTFEVFAAPMIAALMNTAPPRRAVVEARLATGLNSTESSEDWIRVQLSSDGDDLVATPLTRRAGVLTSLVRADGIVVLPAGTPGPGAGDRVPVRLLRT
ncbi:molybdopterin-binding protein [Sporichthya brevicatena]